MDENRFSRLMYEVSSFALKVVSAAFVLEIFNLLTSA